MNLLLGISFVLFGLLLLVSQAQLTVGSDGVHHSGSANGNQHARKRAAALAKGAQLFIETESGATLTRAARGTNDAGNNNAGGEADTVAAAAGAAEAAGTPTKRTKNNRKSNKNFMGENVGHAGGRKHNEKRLHNGNGQQQQQQPLLQHGGNRSGNNNNNHKQQRQMLKSRQQQQQQQGGEELPIAHTRKRSGGKSKQNGENAEKADKNTNGAKSPSTCRYAKSAWSECDAKTNMRSRTLTLKKGESNCLPTRTMQKKCKKACRYEKGSWSECSAGQMTRQDKLKSTGGTSPSPLEVNCDAVRTINKKCNPGGGNGGGNNKQHSRNNKERKHKDKAGRRNTRQD